MDLAGLVDASAPASDIRAHLDALPMEGQRTSVQRLPRSAFTRLFDAVGQNPPASIVDLVPDAGASTAYLLRNNLAMFSHAEKVFFRGERGCFGFNRNRPWLMGLVGPGYFVVAPKADGLEFDYVPPPHMIPKGWPPYRSNQSWLSRPVFGGMTDRVRRVARDVFVGRAFRNGVETKVHFVLIASPTG
jgi:hypothetical protein